jgi:hypothetical protein
VGSFSITQAQVAQAFPQQGVAQPLAPPVAANPAAKTVSSPLLIRQIWAVLAGALIVVSLGINLVFLLRRRANRRV